MTTPSMKYTEILEKDNDLHLVKNTNPESLPYSVVIIRKSSIIHLNSFESSYNARSYYNLLKKSPATLLKDTYQAQQNAIKSQSPRLAKEIGSFRRNGKHAILLAGNPFSHEKHIIVVEMLDDLTVQEATFHSSIESGAIALELSLSPSPLPIRK